MNEVTPSFGDNVRIRETPLTQKLNLSGLAGTVDGETTPSVTGVEAIGEVKGDFAVSVMIEARGEALWFASELVEFVNHVPGTEIKIGSRQLVRDSKGDWTEVSGNNQPPLKRGFIAWLMRSFRGRRT